jgi:hypothetical protein
MVVDNKEEVEGIIDPRSQIIAMSEAVCHDIGLMYDVMFQILLVSKTLITGLCHLQYDSILFTSPLI